jgi:recombination protein RecA
MALLSSKAERILTLPGVRRARLEGAEAPTGWCLPALTGRLSELCSDGAADPKLTLAFGLVLEAQAHDEPVAWVTATASFYPPDVVAGGADLDALLVAHAPDAHAALRAADHFARSGAFGLVIIELGAHAGVPTPLLARLLGLALKHDSAILLITEKSPSTPSLGSLISLRAEARRTPHADGFLCELVAVKDKRRAPGWIHQEVCRGPTGLR